MSLQELFSTFHDFDIVGLETKTEGLLMTLRIPWGELWGEYDFKIKVELKDGQITECKYFEHTGDANSLGQQNSIYRITNDLKTIVKLDLDIQRFETTKDGDYIFHCNGYDKVGGAQIRLQANNYKLLDLQEKPISIDKYESWHKVWWMKFYE
ncbi:MAG: hypothetical protein OEW75_08250 [Cyclobacteriaceae bacterium]|nr:hypothetical protein [Cyclobacteriaceae bacterium]